MKTIVVANLVASDPEIDQLARQVATLAKAEAQNGEDVCISLNGMRGLPSSFYNAIFWDLLDSYDMFWIDRHILFEFDNKLQKDVFLRSRDSVVKRLMEHGSETK